MAWDIRRGQHHSNRLSADTLVTSSSIAFTAFGGAAQPWRRREGRHSGRPWLLWSLVYAFSSFFLWARGWAIGRATGLSILVATAGVLVAGLILALIGQLGIGGRF